MKNSQWGSRCDNLMLSRLKPSCTHSKHGFQTSTLHLWWKQEAHLILHIKSDSKSQKPSRSGETWDRTQAKQGAQSRWLQAEFMSGKTRLQHETVPNTKPAVPLTADFLDNNLNSVGHSVLLLTQYQSVVSGRLTFTDSNTVRSGWMTGRHSNVDVKLLSTAAEWSAGVGILDCVSLCCHQLQHD